MRHGLDADHLATIDGITRCNVPDDPALARMAGALFSLGHGAIVLLVALAVGTLAAGWETPGWLELTGIGVSVVFLFALAIANVRAVVVSPPDAVVGLAGFKGRLLGRVSVRRAWAVTAVGALFALSFDTVSLAALFALAAGRFGGAGHVLVVAGLFVLGMVIVDGANGAWIHGLIRRADRTAAIASRVMALTVAGISLAVGALAVVKVFVPVVGHWAEGRELALGASVVAVVAISSTLAMLAASRRAR